MQFSKLTERALIAVCTLCGSAFLFVSLASVFYKYDLDLYEGVLFPPAIRMASGEPIYGAEVVLKEPFVYAVYGPLYYAFLGFFWRLTGLAFWPGRLLSLLATAATALIIYRTVRLRQGGTSAGIIAVVTFIMSPPTWSFGALQRVDALGVFWSVLAIALVIRSSERRYLFWAGTAAALAFLTKPTLLAAGAGAIVSLLVTRRFKELGAFILGGGSILVLAIALLMLTGNEGYWFNLTSARTPFSLRNTVINLRSLVQSHTLLAMTAIAVIAIMHNRPRKYDFATIFILSCLLTVGVISLITCGRIGASINYFYEFTACLAIFVGLEFDKLVMEQLLAPQAVIHVFLVLALLTELFFFRSGSIRGRLLIPQRKAPLHAKLIQDIAAFVPANEPIVSDYPDLVIRADRQLYFTDTPGYTVDSKPMQSCLHSYLSQRKLAAIVTIGQASVPGYKLVEGYGYNDSALYNGRICQWPFAIPA